MVKNRALNAGPWCALALLAAPFTGAADWGADVGLTAIHSSNVRREPNGDSGALGVADVNAQLLATGRVTAVDLEAAAQRRNFVDSDFENDTLAQARLDASWTPLPDRFSWILRDNLGQIALTPVDSLLPSDRRNANVLSTGPAVFVPLGTRSRLALSGLYSDIYYEDSDLGNTRKTGRMSLERQTGAGHTVYLTAFGNRTEFKQDFLGGYDLTGAHLGFDGTARRSTILVEVGAERLKHAAQSSTGGYFDANLDRQLGRRLSLSLRFVERYADTADIFALDQNMEPVLGGTENVQLSGDPVRQRRANLGLRWLGDRTTVGLSLLWNTETVDSTALPDRTIRGLEVQAERRISARSTLQASAYLLQEQRNGILDEDQDDAAFSLAFVTQITAKTQLQARVQQFSRANSPGDYSETRALVMLRYAPRQLQGARPSFSERQLRRRVGASASEPASGGSTSPPSRGDRPPPP